ncbi:MAG TPA: hypothetical protein VGO93_26820 [Candidatus Xenobia bacterium]|jgi:hypothetical protein
MSVGEWWRDYSQQMRDTSLILNELMAITTEHEETIFNIGKETFQLYRKNQIFDVVAVDMCKRIEETVRGLEKHKKDFNDFEELVAGDLAKDAVGKVSFKLKQGANNFFLNRDLESGRAALRDTYEELGRRVYGGDGNVTSNPRIRRMCLYATRVKADQDAKWKELETKHKEGRSGLSFLSGFTSFLVSLMKFGGTYIKSIETQQVAARAKIKSLYQNIHYNTEKDKDAPQMTPVTATLETPNGQPAKSPFTSPSGRVGPPPAADPTAARPLPPAQNWPMSGQPAAPAQNWPMTPRQTPPAPPPPPGAAPPQWPMGGGPAPGNPPSGSGGPPS